MYRNSSFALCNSVPFIYRVFCVTNVKYKANFGSIVTLIITRRSLFSIFDFDIMPEKIFSELTPCFKIITNFDLTWNHKSKMIFESTIWSLLVFCAYVCLTLAFVLGFR